MKNFTKLMLVAIVLSSCAKPMYYWGDYDGAFYSHQKNLDDKSARKLLAAYKDMVNNAKKKSVRQVPPPGIYADYGFMLIKEGREREGERMLEKEMQTYPESAFFIQQLLKMMDDRVDENQKKSSR